jgi:quinolinate synthase
MKRITLDGILHSLRTMTHEVIVPADVAAQAKAPIDRMLAVKA